MFTKTRAHALLQHLDSLIEKYDQSNPELTKDLRAHRDALQEYLRRGNAAETAKALLRISVWIKFMYDRWSDG